jgi:hypothetical protein
MDTDRWTAEETDYSLPLKNVWRTICFSNEVSEYGQGNVVIESIII